MNDIDLNTALATGLPPIPPPVGLDSTDCTDVLKGNADLELPDDVRMAKEECCG